MYKECIHCNGEKVSAKKKKLIKMISGGEPNMLAYTKLGLTSLQVKTWRDSDEFFAFDMAQAKKDRSATRIAKRIELEKKRNG